MPIEHNNTNFASRYIQEKKKNIRRGRRDWQRFSEMCSSTFLRRTFVDLSPWRAVRTENNESSVLRKSDVTSHLPPVGLRSILSKLRKNTCTDDDITTSRVSRAICFSLRNNYARMTRSDRCSTIDGGIRLTQRDENVGYFFREASSSSLSLSLPRQYVYRMFVSN